MATLAHPAQLDGLLAPCAEIDGGSFAEIWSWLVLPGDQPFLVNAIGDVFFTRGGDICWLDVGASQVAKLADDQTSFFRLASEDDNLDEWFLPDLVSALSTALGSLPPGACYSWVIPPTLSGAFEPANFHIMELGAHLRGLAAIQRQVSNLPIGARISEVNLEGRDA